MPGARRARSLACRKKKAHEHSHHGHTGNHPAFPAQWFTAYFALSPAIGLVCHRRLARLLARLDAGVEASEPHDFAVREKRPRLWRRPRPPHPAPRFVTIASRPSVWDGTARISELIWVTGEGKYFCVGDWTGFLADSPSGKSRAANQPERIRAMRCMRVNQHYSVWQWDHDPVRIQRSITSEIESTIRTRTHKFRGVGKRPLWNAFRTQVGHRGRFEKCQQQTSPKFCWPTALRLRKESWA